MRFYINASTNNPFERFVDKDLWVLVVSKDSKNPRSAEDQYYMHILTKGANYWQCKVECISALIVECEYPDEDLYFEEYLTGYHGSRGEFDDTYVNLDEFQLVDPPETLTTDE